MDRQVEQLEKFGQLYKEGLLSKEEFEKKKREILGQQYKIWKTIASQSHQQGIGFVYF